jgi:hypothetical protein
MMNLVSLTKGRDGSKLHKARIAGEILVSSRKFSILYMYTVALSKKSARNVPMFAADSLPRNSSRVSCDASCSCPHILLK